jgi:hypothetical protein
MSKESEVTKYHNQFLDLAELLLNACILEDKDFNALFWYGFHPDDHAMLLYYFSEYPRQPPGVYYHLQEAYNAACDIFSQRPAQIQHKCQDALRWGM